MAGETRVEAMVGPGVIAEPAADFARLQDGVVSRNARVAAARNKKRGKNSQESGFARAIGAENRDRFSFAYFERKTGECDDGRLFERLDESAPTAACRREQLFQRFDGDGGFGHQKTYSVSSARRQSEGAIWVHEREEKSAGPSRMAQPRNPR
jgi:hypothetical protein